MQPLNKHSPATWKSVIPTTQECGGNRACFLDQYAEVAPDFEKQKHENAKARLTLERNVRFDVMVRCGLCQTGFVIQLLTGLSIVVLSVMVCSQTSFAESQTPMNGGLAGFDALEAQRLPFATNEQAGKWHHRVDAAGAAKAISATSDSAISVSGQGETRQFTISRLLINRRDIFGSEVNSADLTRRVYKLIDALHVTTREKTILREIDLEPGDRLYANDVAELERNLRAMGLFASVTVKLIPMDDSYAELRINTRDRLSVVFGASGSFLGGIGELGFTVGERNVNGSGDRLLLSYSGTTDGQLRGAIAYDDIHFIDNRHSAEYSLGRTEEGRFYHVKFSRPFKTQVKDLSWSVTAESIGSEIDFFEDGVSVAQVPQQSDSLILEAYRRVASDESVASGFSRYFRYGTVLRFDRKNFEPTRGLQPNLVEAPLDNTRIFAGGLLALSRNTRFEKTSGVDSVRFTEDLAFGYSTELLAGVDLNDNAGDVREIEPAIFVEARYTFGSSIVGDVAEKQKPFSILPARTFGKVSFDGYSNLQSGDMRSWSTGLTLKLFNRSFESHTFASRFSYITSDRGDELPTQYTLGENNGLRGYAARQFSGRSRFRVNLEDRIHTGWRVGAFDIGLLTFIDAGWAGDDTSQLSLKTAAGVGLRLGSNALLGADVARLDLAYPFDPVDGESRLSVSLSLGQVFTF